jgi:hypothetical protein
VDIFPCHNYRLAILWHGICAIFIPANHYAPHRKQKPVLPKMTVTRIQDDTRDSELRTCAKSAQFLRKKTAKNSINFPLKH